MCACGSPGPACRCRPACPLTCTRPGRPGRLGFSCPGPTLVWSSLGRRPCHRTQTTGTRPATATELGATSVMKGRGRRSTGGDGGGGGVDLWIYGSRSIRNTGGKRQDSVSKRCETRWGGQRRQWSYGGKTSREWRPVPRMCWPFISVTLERARLRSRPAHPSHSRLRNLTIAALVLYVYNLNSTDVIASQIPPPGHHTGARTRHVFG